MTAQITKLHYHQPSRLLDVHLDNRDMHTISAELLRVFSPSAEVRGHGPEQETLVINKQSVEIVKLNYVGNYAVKIVFSDGHNTGIYSWAYLIDLAVNQKDYQAKYDAKLAHVKVTSTTGINLKNI